MHDRVVTTTKQPRRKLVDTQLVKIARDYVSPQSEESYMNDNHLKGYYEDEDFRTTHSGKTCGTKNSPTRLVSRVASLSFCLRYDIHLFRNTR